jgi:hypothetical protein
MTLVVGVSTLLLCALPATALDGKDERRAQQQSVRAVQRVAVSLMTWWVDFGGGDTDPGDPWAEWALLDWSQCRVLSPEEATELLVPRHIAELPVDGWGNPLELCVRDDEPPAPRHVVAVRSLGRDGEPDGSVYEPGRFPATELDRDIVAVDGYLFVEPKPPE